MAEHTVASGAVQLAVRTSGDPENPAVVLVHGFPDTQQMWEPLASLLRTDHYVISYDVRGAGRSTRPPQLAGYRTARLVDDLVAVLNAVGPSRAVHLVGHDWGSVQLWDAVSSEPTDDRLRGRIASFTSISGPPLDYFGDFLRTAWRTGQARDALRQLRHSWYIAAFQVPYVPEWVFRRLGTRLQSSLNRSQRLGDGHWAATFGEDGANGVNLYRANAVGRPRSPRSVRTTVPVQVLLPRYDDFLLPEMYARLGDYVERLTTHELDAGHWVPRTHPKLVAERVRDMTKRT